jgi:short-subunit dehydrogenase
MIHKNRSNPVAVVTGGTKGIGLAICNILADKGFDLITCARHQDDLDTMQQNFSHRSIRLETFRADLSQSDEVQAFADFIMNNTDRLEILVNNAGMFSPGEILQEPEGQLDIMIRTNLFSAYHLTRAVFRLMPDGNKPHIFNICSIASKIAYPNGGSYSISKFALLGFSKVLREEAKTKGIRVTALLPGATWSDSWKGVNLPESRLMPATDIAHLLWSAYALSASADVEEIVIRPQLGDL